ncbi:DUF6048 family protein [Mesohalobacter halotolerans]|uniref:Porin family protein n=1 Tax=Mesohalobacter halotolerans TaxID=1883405 RepID=A0A4U5TQC8_9FLAO|nr:DUF6048 family protein [Mesohalobacter halotolerans]MBS3738568.1 hypothetical protein [Psychroflexus sp.]TKS56397.1 porin family protein [Mesohalobacter halotolerans]
MNKTRTLISIISLCLFSIINQSFAQNDSLVYNERYGASFGIDLFKITRTALDDNYTGFEINADYRFTDEIYLAGEMGNDQFTFDESNLVVNSDGSYIKLGANYNFYKNWIGMQNQIYAGFRVGLSSYSQSLKEFNFFTSDNTFEPETQVVNREFNNLSALWTEFHFGFEVELIKNVFAGAHVQLKFLVSETDLQNFDNIFIPGFNITNDFSLIGAGWGYSLSYLIPFKNKRKTQSVRPE